MYTKQAIQNILLQVSKSKISPQKAYEKLRHLSYETLHFAKIDHHRPLRKNLPEVVYAPGKTAAQLKKIMAALIRKKHPLLVTRLEEHQFRKLKKRFPKLHYSKVASIAYVSSHLSAKQIGGPTTYSGGNPPPQEGGRLIVPEKNGKHFLPPRWGKARMGVVAIVTAGTSDIPVAEEAKITLETVGRKVNTFYDLGVAGLHRLLDHIKEIESADAVICIAGMEGALPSVLAGLISKPIIAVPTSVGYGAGFKGITPLLTMLNTCAQGVAVVNIDSGFNAACFAHLLCG